MFTYSHLGTNGRLGNQLFQMACTIATAMSHGDMFSFPAWQYEKDFNLHHCFEQLAVTEKYGEPFFHFQPIKIADSKSKIIDLQGFFQSLKYFEEYERVIKFAFTPNNLPIAELNKTAIHVRRGDYLKFQDSHPTLTLDYYKQAIKKAPAEKYVIFSDDIDWCKKNFKGAKYEFSEGRSEVEDLAYMLSMKNNIIANSSFSWWAAYLNPNPEKIVVAPETWFGPALTATHDTKDLIPNKWMRI